MRANVLLIAFLGLAILPGGGQAAPAASSKAAASRQGRFDFGLTFTEKYAKISTTTNSYFNLPGGSVDVSYTFRKAPRLALAVDVQGEATTKDVALGYGLKQISYVAGPRVFLWEQKGPERRANIYAEALAGGVHAWDSIFITGQTATTSANSFALQAGGGVNLPLSKSIGLRVAEVDFILTKLPNDNNNFQGDIRFSTGLTFHFF